MFTLAVCLLLKAEAIIVSPAGPVKTIAQAVDLHRKNGGRCIKITPGVYFVSEPVNLDGRDAGLSIEGSGQAKTVLSGGIKLVGWRQDKSNLWVCDVPKGSDFRMLLVGGIPRERSRFPQSGRLKHQSVFDVPWMSTTGGGWKRKPTDVELTTMKCDPNDLGSWLQPGSAEVTVFHMWDESCVGVKSYNAQTGDMVFSSPLGHPAGAFGVQDYVVWNAAKGMTKPGTWYLDKEASKVYYWPLPKDDLKKMDVIAPKIDAVFRLAKGADRIAIRNLSVAAANTPLRAAGFGAGDAEAAIRLENAKDCTIESVAISGTSGAGIRAWASPSLKVSKCQIRYTGGCGIRSDCDSALIADNTVSKVGILYPSAAGIWATGKNTVVSHNSVSDTPYSAIIGGGENQIIEKNVISRCMQVMHDGAGIYAGFASGMVYRGNVVRDVVDTGGYGASAYYLDEQASNCIVEDNLSVNIVTPCHNHMAKNNTIRNNVFISDREMRLTFPRCTGYRFEKNVLHAKDGITFFFSDDGMASILDNIIYSLAGTYNHEVYDGMYAVKEKRQLNRGGVFANPRFVNAQSGDYSFRSDSVALVKGIKSQRWDDVGPRK